MNDNAPVIYSSLLRRIQAALVDSLIVIVMMGCLLALLVSTFPELPGPVRAAAIFSPLLFLEPVMLSIWGGTVGYLIFNQVVTRNGTNEYLGPVRAFGRYLVKIILGWLSLVFMLTTRRHQALHDLFADSVVKVRDSSKVEAPERYLERVEDTHLYVYPSPTRRILVILIYIVFVLVVLTASTFFFISSPCLEFNRCSAMDRVVEPVYSLFLLAGVGVSIVLGWRGRLFGCRRRIRDADA